MRKFKATFITKLGHTVTEYHKSIADVKLRAAALGWVVENVCLNIVGDEL